MFQNCPIQKLNTRVVKHDVNPEWDEDLTLFIADPHLPIQLSAYDRDTFSPDDKMGDAEFYITDYLQALRMRF
ncbi:hypothetical protein Patl1_37671 [Pistacia atlantica]|nr:hypothetical protein Patl1_37671 [Pistacia atlantica]